MPTQTKVGGDGVSPTPSSLHLKTGLFCAFAALLFSGQHATAQEETWIGPSDSPWSSGASWLDGTAPIVGGDPALTIRLGASGTSLNDLAGPFALNQMVFSAKLGTRVSASAGGGLNFVGIDPTISLEGIRDAVISAPIVLNSTSSGLLIKSTGPANLLLFNSVTEGDQPQIVTIDTKARSLKTGAVRLFNAINATGGVILKSGNLEFASSPASITGTLNAHSGTITLTSAVRNLSNAIVLHGDVTLRSTSSIGATLSGVISGAAPEAGLLVRPENGMSINFTGASIYTGPTTLDYSSVPELAVVGGGEMNLSGPNGSILQTSEFNVRADSTLRLEGLTATDNRVGDTTPIHLRGSSLVYSLASGGTDSLRTEVTGPIDGAGFSTISVFTTATTAGLRLQLASLTRTERGTFIFKGTGLGNDPAIGVGNIFIAAAPTDLVGGGGTGPKTSILPYAVGTVSNLIEFVTYSPTAGIRPLSSTEYRPLILAAVDENARVATAETLNASRTVNSLVIDGGSIGLYGTGTLTISSGALLQREFNSLPRIFYPVAFGSAEANIFVSGELSLFGGISGTNGLTKSGPGKLRLGPNTLTGPLTINDGTISFALAERLGPDNSPIMINGHNAGLIYSGTNPLDFNRPIETRTGLARIEASGGGNFNITSPIAGAGGLQLVTSNNGTIFLPSGSTYTGTTYLGEALLAPATSISIPNDSAFGSGGAVHVDGGKIVLTGAWNSTREINFRSATLDTAGFDAALLGPLSANSTFTLTKTGAGRLKIADASQFKGALAVNAGTFEIAGYLSGSVSASVGTTVTGEGLIGDILNISGILEPGGGIGEITAGTLQLEANSTLRLRLDSLAEYDRLVSANAPSLGSGITLELQFAPGYDPVEFVDQFTVIRNDSASPITMAVADPFVFEGNPLSEGEQFAAGGTLWSISYQGGSGNDVVLSAVPEPASGVILVAAASVLGLSRRRRC